MEQREVLVTLISASDLKKAAFGKLSIYGVAWIYPTVKVSSPVDKKGNSNPTWNAILKLMADERLVEDGNAVLVIDLYDHGTFGSTKVGSCTIPLTGLKAPAKATTEKEGKEDKDANADKMPAATSMEGGSSSSSSSFMTVPILGKSGKSHGILKLSIKLGELVKHSQPQMAAPSPSFSQQAKSGYENKNIGGAPPYAYPAAGYPPANGQPGYGPPGAAAEPYPMYQQAPYQQESYQQAPYQQAPYQQAPYQQAPYQQAPYPGQMPPPYYPQGGYAPPPPQQQKRSGFMGGGLGVGLAGGALGGLLLGSALDGGGGDGGGDGGGGCGGGGCGGGCGG